MVHQSASTRFEKIGKGHIFWIDYCQNLHLPLLDSTVGNALNSYYRGWQIEPLSGVCGWDLSTKTLLPWVTPWWGVGVTRLASAREAKQLVGGRKPGTFFFFFFSLTWKFHWIENVGVQGSFMHPKMNFENIFFSLWCIHSPFKG